MKRTFASRTFMPRNFASHTLAGEGVLLVVTDLYTRRLQLIGAPETRLVLNATAKTRLVITGSSK